MSNDDFYEICNKIERGADTAAHVADRFFEISERRALAKHRERRLAAERAEKAIDHAEKTLQRLLSN